MKEKSDIINKNFSSSSFDDQEFKRLWIETHQHRPNFIKQHTTADILKEYPLYSNPTMVSKRFYLSFFKIIILDFR